MIDLLPEFLLNEPRRLLALGRGLVWAGGMILVLGAIGRVATVGQAAVLSLSGRNGSAPSLADIYPTLPTWFVPESLIGCLPAAFLIVLGLGAASLGRNLLRFI